MREAILNTLIQLYALVANATETESQGRTFVKALLIKHISYRFISDYLVLFDNHLNFYQRDFPASTANDQEKHRIIEQYVEQVCLKLRKELPKNERILVLLRILEYVYKDLVVTQVEEIIIDTIAKTFSINPIDSQELKLFIFQKNCNEIDPERLLTIESNLKITEDRIRTDETIQGKLCFLRVNSINSFIVLYHGTAELYLDGATIESGTPYLMEIGAIIRGPKTDPIYYTDLTSWYYGNKQRQHIVFTAKDVDFKFRNSENGIHSFSFSEESGQLIGIMGSSGVGKSTLLNILTGKIMPNRGCVEINGFDIHRDKQAVEGIIGYVPQDDLLFEELSVYQNLYYNAKLCFSKFTELEIKQTVNSILNDLDLWDIQRFKVGSPLNKMISGGQRKRLNIGLELMREPSILFVDEPTSGLSSSDSLMVMSLLKNQANKGRLVITNIHQPSSKVFRLLDKLWVLDRGGYPIYTGDPEDAIVYFKTMTTRVNASESRCTTCGNINPEQILEIVEAKVIDQNGVVTQKRQHTPIEWNTIYKKEIGQSCKPKKHKAQLPQNPFNIPNIEVQFKVFSIRNLLSKLANRQYVFINLLETPILAFVLAFFTKYIPNDIYIFAENKNIPSYLFMSVVVSLFIGLMVSAEEIFNDKKILERESFLNLSRFSYLNAKIAYLFALSALQMAMFVLIGNAILEIEGMTLNYWLILFSTTCFANMLGLNISAGLNSVVAIYITIPFILVPQILLSGTVVQFDNLHPSITNRVYVPVVGDVMVSRWAYEALAVEQFKKNKFNSHFFDYEQQVSNSHFIVAFLVPRLQNLVDECVRIYNRDELQLARYKRNLKIISNELIQLSLQKNAPPFEYIGNLNPNDFSEQIAEEVTGYLIFMRIMYNGIADAARQKKDSVYNSMVDNIGSDAVFALRQNNTNKALTDWVLNNNEVTKFLETDKRIIQKFEPIYMIPNHQWGRAHFYAPVKQFNNQLVDTIWFNLAAIWLGSLLLFVTLQVNLLGRSISYLEGIWVSNKTRKQDTLLTRD
ncbi:MAG: ATP-binding cassette domain-containing protein [Bacteroidales bacterium]|nr:ATP-binding cassette domain-containing protein [Bacteroidales bacterium]